MTAQNERPTRPIFFFHVSSSGGTSLCRWAQQQPCSRVPACGSILQLQPELSAPMGLEALLPATCMRFARESVPGAIPARVRGIGTVCATS